MPTRAACRPTPVRSSTVAAGSSYRADGAKMSPAGRDRQRLLTSQAMICRCWAALKCRGSSADVSPTSEMTRPIPPSMAAVSAAVRPKRRGRRARWALLEWRRERSSIHDSGSFGTREWYGLARAD